MKKDLQEKMAAGAVVALRAPEISTAQSEGVLSLHFDQQQSSGSCVLTIGVAANADALPQLRQGRVVIL